MNEIIDILLPYLWSGVLIFIRVGCVLMLAPGWGENFVPTSFRLAGALLSSIVLSPVIGPILPPLALSDLAVFVLYEALIGLMIGAAARLFMSAAHIAGQIAALHGGLAMAQQFDPNAGQTASATGLLLSMLTVALALAVGIHGLMLKAAADSYARFPPGELLPMGDAAMWALSSISAAFELGVRIAAPVIVFALIFNMALGLINRLIPQVQIFFVALPSSVLLGLIVLAMGMGGGLLAWLEALESHAMLLAPA